ncbi:hypothetical protein SMKI_09G1070 [Saccharomyces mikatae IFO 1815]|uniref:Actin-related protein 2/3 complex subunit 5 n=1 Tax=Saccharomyces mikatae IFO 1815 TaxID=226126 RepID=A0AA35IZD0_SACMI|nr:uncharacterized protein SMKI_09G1070 [Saccharomyces mikatae IFO 1815]CAI4039699.1 hypothetical protein SMKI_09G1070 [Saccharomyces mikatae IFO 1815]
MEADWRRIDIDAYDPESGRLTAADLVPPYQTTVTLQELQPRMNQLRSLATSGDSTGAVQLLTTDPPYSADTATKEQYFGSVLEALTQVRQADIGNVIKTLSDSQKDVLVKYLYKGMSVPQGQKQGGILLAWLEKVTQVSGVTPIVHYISDRRTV